MIAAELLKGSATQQAEVEGKKFGLKPIFFTHFEKILQKSLDFLLLNEYNRRKFIIKEQGKMKEFIEKSGLTAAQFAKKYGIPYNTVRQWAEGLRSAPEWLKNLFKNEQEYKPLIEYTEKNTSLEEKITEQGITKTITTFEYVIYYKAQNGAFIKVPADLLIEQFKTLSKKEA